MHAMPLSRPLFFVSSSALLAIALAACSPARDAPDATAASGPTPAEAEAGASADNDAATRAPAAAGEPGAPTDAGAGPAIADTAACDAQAAQAFVGKEGSEANVAAAKAAAGARGDVRVIQPGQPVTMDFRQDRLNVEVGDGGTITRITCG